MSNPYAAIIDSDSPTLRDAQRWDVEDPLAPMRSRFSLPEGVIYLDGMSLGPLPRRAVERANQVLQQQWGEGLIRSWNDADWINAPQRIGGKIAGLIGAAEDEVLVADSTSVNWYKMLHVALQLRPGRKTILLDRQSFPTNLYVAQGLQSMLPDVQLRLVDADAWPATDWRGLDSDVAVAALTHADYRTSALQDMSVITRAAHAAGALVLWDLCHSAGATPLSLSEHDVDLAVGCGYKYLNGGPGAPAYLYVARRLQAEARQPITGWLGHASPFEFSLEYQPAAGVKRMQSGTPPILALATLEAAIDDWRGVDLQLVQAKTAALGQVFLQPLEPLLQRGELTCASPIAAEHRGGHVALRHPEAYRIVQAMIHEGVIGDFRAPDLMRWGMTPLYVGFEDAWRAACRLRDIIESRAYLAPQFAVRRTVT